MTIKHGRTSHDTDIVHYFLDQRNGVLTWEVIEGNKDAERHTNRRQDYDNPHNRNDR